MCEKLSKSGSVRLDACKILLLGCVWHGCGGFQIFSLPSQSCLYEDLFDCVFVTSDISKSLGPICLSPSGVL